MTRKASAPSQGEVPQYKLTEPAYIDDKYLEAGAAIYFTGVPGAHMHPLNDAAQAMIDKHKPVKVDPVEKLSMLSEPPAAQLNA